MLEQLGSNTVSPRVVAEKVFEAATDGTDQLRYPATPDAIAMLEKRNNESDEQFIGDIRRQFGL